jgi:CheY-like chemotaxis protein
MLKRKILLAEDDEDDRQFFQDFLEDRSDIDLMPVAENGVSLIEFLKNIADRSGLPDLIILDQNMPKKNGLQTLQFLKEEKRFQHIPVVIYSTYIDEHLKKSGTEKGACIVLPKPITKEGYVEMLETLIRVC